jgi:hypothetical protein
MRPTSRRFLTAALGGLLLAGCDVTNPGPVLDENLNNPASVPVLVSGMSADVSMALGGGGGGGGLLAISSLAGDDIWHGGSYVAQGLWVRGILNPDDMNAIWARMHRARWVAEDGLRRMAAMENYTNFGNDTYSARANLYAGFANRMLGEHVCFSVIDGGPEEDFRNHFSRALGYFSEALTIATKINDATLKNAAYAGIAQILAAQGKWNEAADTAAKVPTNFVYYSLHSTNSSRENNDFVVETVTSRREYTVYNSRWATVTDDARVKWVKTTLKGQDGVTPYYRQQKYLDNGADVALAKGTDMLMIRAEAKLRANDIPGAWTLVNLQRVFYGMPALAVPATIEAAWATFQVDRAAVLWLEGRRFWDLRRWNAEAPPIKNTYLDDRDKCFPTSTEERIANKNID